MRSLIALQALVALASAQAESFSFGATRSLHPATTGEIQPTVTQTISGPVSTASACSQIAGLVDKSVLDFPSVEAEVSSSFLRDVGIELRSQTCRAAQEE